MATNEEVDDKQQQQQEEDLDFEVVVEGEEPAGDKQKQAGNLDDSQDDDDSGDRRARSGGERRDEERDDKDDENLTPEQREKRERRRKERQLRKQRQEERDRELEELRAELAELRGAVGTQSQSIRQSEYRRVTSALAAATAQMQEAQSLMQDAKKAENWSAAFDAQEAFLEARTRAERLNVIKTQFEQAGSGQDGGDGGERRQSRPNPEITRRAREWRSKNSWYDPERRDADSKIAAAIDEQLAEEDFDPRTTAYWKELDKRIAQQLPHRASRDRVDELDDDVDDTPSQTQGSGRERSANGRRVVKLSRERVEALREAGVDVKDKKAMAPYLKRFAQWDKENAHLLKGQ